MPATGKGRPLREARGGSKSKPNKASMGERAPSPSSINLWGIAGRQEIMEMRRLWQLRIPRR